MHDWAIWFSTLLVIVISFFLSYFSVPTRSRTTSYYYKITKTTTTTPTAAAACTTCFGLLLKISWNQNKNLHQRSGLDELEVLDKVSRLSIDPFQQNRRLSETTLLDLHSPTNRRGGGHHGHEGLHGGGGGNGASCQSRSESHSVAQSPPFENNSTASSLLDLDNPFQNDQLPVWQNQQTSSTVLRPTKVRRGGHGDGGSSTMTPTSPSETSSPDNNYGGQGRAYCYQNLNETPLSPDLVNHRQRLQQDCGGLSPPSSPVAQVIQVSTYKYNLYDYYFVYIFFYQFCIRYLQNYEYNGHVNKYIFLPILKRFIAKQCV